MTINLSPQYIKIFLLIFILTYTVQSIQLSHQYSSLGFDFKQLGRITTSSIINVQTTYTFIFDRTGTNTGQSTNWDKQSVISTANISVEFPSDYTFTGSQTCSNLEIVTSTQTIPIFNFNCIIQGKKIIFKNALTGISNLFIKQATVSFGNIKNPYPAIKTGQFTGYLGIDTAVPFGGTSITLQAGPFNSCTVTFGNGSIVNQTSPAIISVRNLNQLNSTSTLRVTFPSYKFWINDLSATLLPISSGTMNCTGINGIANVNSVTCSGNYIAFTVIASNLFSSNISSNSDISFQINNFLSPPTLQPSDKLKITSYINGYEVDTCNVYVSNLKPNVFQSLRITPITTPMIVNSKVGVIINMTFSDTVTQDDTFRITFPSQIGTTFTSVITSGSDGTSNLLNNVLTLTQNQLVIRNFWKNSFFVIRFSTITAPSSVKTTQPIIVEILKNGYLKMSGSVTLTASLSSITGSVVPESNLIDNSTVYTFSITLNDQLSSSGWLQIIFPLNIKLPNTLSSISIANGTSLSTNPSYSINTTENKLTITAINSSSLNIPSQTFSLVISLIKNPSSTRPTNNFTILSYFQSSSQYGVARGSFQGITATYATLSASNITIAKSSDIVLDSLVTYNISVTISHQLPINGYFKLEIPSDIGIDLNNLDTNCFVINNLTNSAANRQSGDCTGTLNTSTKKYQIKVNNLAINSALLPGTSIRIILDSICTNPDSTRNILGFTVSTYDSTFPIQVSSSSIYIRASIPTTCRDVSITRISSKNSESTNYTVLLRQKSAFLPQSIINLAIPVLLSVSSNSKCIDSTTNTVLPCDFQKTSTLNTITVNLSNTAIISSLTYISIIITNILNHVSYQPLSDTLSIVTKTPDNLNKYCEYSSIMTFTNNLPSLFSYVQGIYSPRIYGELTSLVIDLKPSTRIIPSYFVLSLETSMKIQALTCSYINVVSGQCQIVSTNLIKIKGIFTSNQMQFTIGGVRAPKYASTTPKLTSISSFTSADYKIDQTSSSITSNIIQFIVKCNLPCKTCADSNLSQCQSCYQDQNISTEIYYLPANKMCYSICPNGFYEDSLTLQCQQCNSFCLTCDILSTNCTSCNTSSLLPYLNKTSGTCIGKCPTYYYPDLLNSPIICILCQPPCNDCINKSTCLSCVSPYYFYNGQCKTSCPAGTTIANNITRKCDVCSSICATCSITVDNCSTCSSDAAFYNNTCISVCPPPLVVNAGKCTQCDTLCKTCSIKANNCTSCVTTSNYPYLYNYSCYNSCPDFYYKNILQGLCKQCVLLNIGCKNCSSVSTCYSCDAEFVFLSAKCYNVTPSGYYNDSGYAKPCSGDCATCQNFANNCTACKTLNLFSNKCINTCPDTLIGQNKICISCQPSCLTCSNIKTNCTSCLPDLTPQVYLNNYYCTTTCPQFTYGNSTTNKCTACQSPCLQCTGQIVCINCVNGYYLLDSACKSVCPSGYIAIDSNRKCQLCTSPCQTCSISKNRCNSCVNGYYLYNSSSPSCVVDCKVYNLYPDLLTEVCVGCNLSLCKTCLNTSIMCGSCNSGQYLQQTNCVNKCSNGYYPNTNNTCTKCAIECRTCTSQSYCLTCILGYYLHLNYCVKQCPSTYPVITINGSCSKCTDKACQECTNNDYCKYCIQPYNLYLGKCVQKCPENYNAVLDTDNNKYNDSMVCIFDSSSNQVTKSLSGGNLFPVPLTIAAFFIAIATIMSKFQNPSTHIAGVLFSLFGLLEWISIIITIYLFYYNYGYNKIQLLILISSLGFLYFLNFFALIFQNGYYLRKDKIFNKYISLSGNVCFYVVISIIGFFITHKIKTFMFTKMFNFNILKAKLQNIQNFRIFNIFNFLSFLSSAGILFSMGLIFSTYTMDIDQKLMAYIDSTVLTILNSKKDSNFFEQINQQGYIFNKRIQQSDQILHDAIMPLTKQQKFQQYNYANAKTAQNLYSAKYLNYQSQYQSVRDVSIQAKQILGEQSRILRLNSQDLSDLNLFEKKQISIQYDEPPVPLNDQSVNMSFKNKNQISIQVQQNKEQVSVQYVPNQLDQWIGMSRQERSMSIQANATKNQISIQYSAKPRFVQIDQDYHSQQQVDDFSKTQLEQDLSDSYVQTNKLNRPQIKQIDSLIKQQLDLDIQQKIRQRQQIKKREQQNIKRLKIIQGMKKKSKQLSSNQYQNKNKFQPINKNNIDQLYQNQNISNTMNINSKDQIDFNLNNIAKSNKQSLLNSNQSNVYEDKNKQQFSNYQNNQQNTEIQIIQILSGNKQDQNNKISQNNTDKNRKDLKQQNFKKNKPKNININIHNSSSSLISQNEISLNWSLDEPNLPLETNKKHHNQYQNQQNNKIKKIYKFESKDKQLDDNDSQEQDYQERILEKPNNLQQNSHQYTKSISTKLQSTQKYKPPLPRNNLKNNQQFFDSSQDLQASLQQSFFDQTNRQDLIIYGPLKPTINQNMVLNHYQRENQQNFQKMHYNNALRKQEYHNEEIQGKKINLTQFLEKKGRNMNSSTIAKNSQNFLNEQNSNNLNNKSSSQQQQQQQIQRQQPLPLPENQDEKQDNNLQFGQDEKVIIEPFESNQNINSKELSLPRGLRPNKLKRNSKQKQELNYSKNKNKKSFSKQKQKPIYNQLLNPSSSLKNIKSSSLKQLQKQQKKAQERKKNLELMQGMLQRPMNKKRDYLKQENNILQHQRRSSVQKIYLNKVYKPNN